MQAMSFENETGTQSIR